MSDQVVNVFQLALDRLDISKANTDEVSKVKAAIKIQSMVLLIEIASKVATICGKDEAIELLRTTADSLELLKN